MKGRKGEGGGLGFWEVGCGVECDDVNQTRMPRVMRVNCINRLIQSKGQPLDFSGASVYIRTHILIHISICLGVLCKPHRGLVMANQVGFAGIFQCSTHTPHPPNPSTLKTFPLHQPSSQTIFLKIHKFFTNSS